MIVWHLSGTMGAGLKELYCSLSFARFSPSLIFSSNLFWNDIVHFVGVETGINFTCSYH